MPQLFPPLMKELKVSKLSILNMQKHFVDYTSFPPQKKEWLQYLVNRRHKKLSSSIDSDRKVQRQFTIQEQKKIHIDTYLHIL